MSTTTSGLPQRWKTFRTSVRRKRLELRKAHFQPMARWQHAASPGGTSSTPANITLTSLWKTNNASLHGTNTSVPVFFIYENRNILNNISYFYTVHGSFVFKLHTLYFPCFEYFWIYSVSYYTAYQLATKVYAPFTFLFLTKYFCCSTTHIFWKEHFIAQNLVCCNTCRSTFKTEALFFRGIWKIAILAR